MAPHCTAQRQLIKMARCLADHALVVVLPGLAHPVVITKDTIAIGCLTHSAAEWEAMPDDEIAAISDNILPLWQRYRAIIIQLAGI